MTTKRIKQPVSADTVELGQYIVVPNYVSKKQCEIWSRQLLENYQDWVSFQDGAWFFPGSFYMSLEYGRAHHYFCLSKTYNRRLRKITGFLKTMLAVTKYLVGPNGKPCTELRPRFENLGPYWCQGGFHIFNANTAAPEKKPEEKPEEKPEKKPEKVSDELLVPPGPVHRDLAGLLPYPEAMFDRKTRTFTAVLMLEAPDEEGGLSIWRQRSPVRGNNKVKLKPELLDSVRMENGTLVVLDGFLPHQIQAFKSSSEKPFRMTGVVHFLYRTIPYPHWEYWF